MNNDRILVTGATGQQGGAVVTELLGKGADVYGLTRDPASDKGKALVDRGVKVLQGDFQNLEALKAAFEKVDSVFLVTTPFEAGVDAEAEQGIAAVNAAREAGVKYIVYSSVSDADKNTGIPHFDSKYKVEQHLRNSGVPFAILGPVFFFDNYAAPWMLAGMQTGTLAQGMTEDTKLQSVSVKNIGEFSALALTEKDRFLGKRINFAGDSLSGPEYAKAISQVSGTDLGYFNVPGDKLREAAGEDMALMYEWFVSTGYSADIDALKKDYSEVSWDGFTQWAGRQDWTALSETVAE